MSWFVSIKRNIASPFTKVQRKLFNFIYTAPQSSNSKIFYDRPINSATYKARLAYDLHSNMQTCFVVDPIKEYPKKILFDATIFTSSENTNIYDQNKQYIIFICDADTCYEQFSEKMQELIHDYGNVICFNPPGVGKSSGNTNNITDYQKALRSIIDNLSKHGIPHKNIVLMGHGFGAAIALKTALHYQIQHKRVKVFADRGYESIAGMAATKAQNEVHEYFNNKWLRTIFGTIAYYLTYISVKLFGLNINATETFTEINRINMGDAKGLVVKDDDAIPTTCDIRNGLSANDQQFIHEFECYREAKHNAGFRSLSPIGIPYQRSNTGAAYVNTCLDEFKNETNYNISESWADLAEQQKEEAPSDSTLYLYNTLNNAITYMYDSLNYFISNATSDPDLDKYLEKLKPLRGTEGNKYVSKV
jgi:hypothetical protein